MHGGIYVIRSEEPCDNAKNQLSDFVQAQLFVL
jgi:hypothetical protein